MHEILVSRLGGLSLPRKSVVRLTDRPDMTLDVYRGRKTTTQRQQERKSLIRVNGGNPRYFILLSYSRKRGVGARGEGCVCGGGGGEGQIILKARVCSFWRSPVF